MKIAVHSLASARSIPKETEEIHLVRPMKRKDAEEIIKKCPQLKKVSLSKSCLQRLPEKTKNLFREKGIELVIENRAGRAIGIDLEKMLHVIEMRKDFQPFREIESITGIPKSTAHYLVKYARREKVKKGSNIVYLK